MKIVALVGLAIICGAVPLAACAEGPGLGECRYRASFNCAKADDAASRAICTTPNLLSADCAMGYAYRDARDWPGANRTDSLRKEQRHWVRMRDVACARHPVSERAACLTAETERRLGWLISHYKLPVAGKVYENFGGAAESKPE